MSTRSTLAWFALVLGLIPHILAEVGVLVLIVWAFRLLLGRP